MPDKGMRTPVYEWCAHGLVAAIREVLEQGGLKCQGNCFFNNKKITSFGVHLYNNQP